MKTHRRAHHNRTKPLRKRALPKQNFIQGSRSFNLRRAHSIHNFPIEIYVRSRVMTRPMKIEMVNQYGKNAVRVAIEQTSILLEVEDVDAMIEHLSLVRASMRPEVPKEPSRTHQYVIEMDPCWHSQQHPLYDGAMLFLRHTGLGWAGFALPTHSLAKLSETLSKHLEASLETQGLPN
jgi:hypothetical protein